MMVFPLFAANQSLANALELLVELFEAKIDGAVDTAEFEYINAFVPKSLDEAIQQGIDTIKSSWEFRQIGDEGNIFLDKWTTMEWTFINWDKPKAPLDKQWFRGLLNSCPKARKGT